MKQDDLSNLDIEGGQCYNTSIPQNVTFGYQGLPFGINLGGGKKGAADHLARPHSMLIFLGSGLLSVAGVLAFGGGL
jgi:hypothetical protein